MAKIDGNAVMHLSFPRRVGVTRPAYGFEFSNDMLAWANIPAVTETIISTQIVDGVSVETVDAAIPVTDNGNGFVRIGWK